MDFNYEFLMFQSGKHNTKEKLEYYQEIIRRLLLELETLRETVCASCQLKCVASRSGNPSHAEPDDSMRPLKRHVEGSLPRTPEVDIFLRNLVPGFSSAVLNERMASKSSSLVEIMTQPNTLGNGFNDRMFYAERALVDTAIDITCVYAFRLENSVRDVCFSHDGRYLAVGTGTDKDGSVVIYEVESRNKYCELREYATQYGSHTRHVPWDLCFSSDGRYLAVEDNAKRIIIWDVPKKRIRCVIQGSDHIFDVRFSTDGRLIAFRTCMGLVVLNMRDNSRRMASMALCFDFNPGGRLIARGNDADLAILDVRTGKAVKKWNGYGAILLCLKYTLDGRGLLCAYNDLVERWDLSGTEPVLIRKFDFQIDYVFRPSISPDHRLLAITNRLWDVNGAKRQCTFQGHIDKIPISSVHFSAAGTYLAVGCDDHFVSLWRYTWT